jgi:hypothetical protein
MFYDQIGQGCYSGATSSGNSEDEALFAESIDKNNTF